jgi:hypothetical protein
MLQEQANKLDQSISNRLALLDPQNSANTSSNLVIELSLIVILIQRMFSAPTRLIAAKLLHLPQGNNTLPLRCSTALRIGEDRSDVLT